jgi:hypothetical protein
MPIDEKTLFDLNETEQKINKELADKALGPVSDFLNVATGGELGKNPEALKNLAIEVIMAKLSPESSLDSVLGKVAIARTEYIKQQPQASYVEDRQFGEISQDPEEPAKAISTETKGEMVAELNRLADESITILTKNMVLEFENDHNNVARIEKLLRS